VAIYIFVSLLSGNGNSLGCLLRGLFLCIVWQNATFLNIESVWYVQLPVCFKDLMQLNVVIEVFILILYVES